MFSLTLRQVLGALCISGVLALPPMLAGDSKQDSDSGKTSRRRVRLGGITAGAGYSHSAGYGFWPYSYWNRWHGLWAYPFYDPWWPGAYYHPGYFSGFARGANMGEVRIKEGRKDVSVYLDGAYAGTADKLKNIWLDPGAYNLELRTGSEAYTRRIYVLSGKRLTIEPEYEAKQQEARP
jgi:hypothetical protein